LIVLVKMKLKFKGYKFKTRFLISFVNSSFLFVFLISLFLPMCHKCHVQWWCYSVWLVCCSCNLVSFFFRSTHTHLESLMLKNHLFQFIYEFSRLDMCCLLQKLGMSWNQIDIVRRCLETNFWTHGQIKTIWWKSLGGK
jgi:hypothetical protein